MNPQQLVRDLIVAVLAWEEADAIRMRVADSRSASPKEVAAANAKLVAAIKQLRLVARVLRKLMRNPPKKKMQIDWLKALNVTAKVLGTVSDVANAQKPRVRGEIIDAEVVG